MSLGLDKGRDPLEEGSEEEATTKMADTKQTSTFFGDGS
jgi:hypothetical protein